MQVVGHILINIFFQFLCNALSFYPAPTGMIAPRCAIATSNCLIPSFSSVLIIIVLYKTSCVKELKSSSVSCKFVGLLYFAGQLYVSQNFI